MSKKHRGSGYRHTLPWVFPYFALWVVVLVTTAPVLTIAMMLSGLVPSYLHGDIWFFLFTRVPAIAVAGIVLAVVTSVRAAGPMVQLGRAFEDVARGDMDRRLRFRRGDKSFRGLEAAFNEMMVAVNERVNSPRGLEAEDGAATPPSQGETPEDSYVDPESILLGDG